MTRARCIQIGDLHLTTGAANADRLAALDYALDRECDHADGVDAWFLPGDLNEAGMSIENRNALVVRIQRMSATAPVVILYGNHDRPGDLDVFGHLRNRHEVTVVQRAQLVDLTLPRGSHARIFCLPYPSRAALVGSGAPREETLATAARALDTLCLEAGDQLAEARRRRCVTAMLGHVTIRGAVTSVGQPLIGAELDLDPGSLARLGPCFKGFNHIHAHQILGRDTMSEAWYAGSLCRRDWGEIEPKGYLVVHAGTDGYGVTWQPVPIAPMYHVEGTLTRDDFAWEVAKAARGMGPPVCAACADAPPYEDIDCEQCEGTRVDWRDIDIRVRARYAVSERNVLAAAKARLSRMFGRARRLEIELIAVPERALRAPEIVGARTLDEKLRAWARLTETTWSADIERCAALLQAENADEMIAQTAARLAAAASGTDRASDDDEETVTCR